MQLEFIDWVIMGAYFALALIIGLSVSRSSGQDFSSFFLGGRKMPWWLLGVSMVATTFSTDTPNLVSDIVRSNGTFGNWTWWAFLLTGMLTVFLYAKLWRRSGVFTDVEFYELRYSGKLAAFLRGFRAAYLGIIFNVLMMGAVTLAAIKIAGVMVGTTPLQTVVVAATVVMIYSAAGGLTGVLLTDLFLFTMAMVGSIAAAWYVLTIPEVGGLQALLANPNVQGHLSFLPSLDTMGWQEILPIFIIPLAVQWWAAYYPGAEPGGGGYIVQRMLAAEDEKNAVGATLFFQCMHYAIRPWPWILVALASLVVFPDLEALRTAFPEISSQVVQNDLAYSAMLTFLPAGLLGLVVTSLAAAYMSTMSTQVNWGASIIVNDIYDRFINPNASQRELVWAGRVSTVALMIVACTLALLLESALQIFNIILLVGAGTGLVFLLRWFWWRINAATELAAMIVSFVVAVFLQLGGLELPDWLNLVIGVTITTFAWILVAYMTRPTSNEVLFSFYRKVHPGGPGWNRVRERAREQGLDVDSAATPSDLPWGLLCAALGSVGVYAILFATGYVITGRYGLGAFLFAVALAAGVGIVKAWPRLSFARSYSEAPTQLEKQPP